MEQMPREMAGPAPVFHRALMNALAAVPGDKLRPTDDQLVGMSWRLARESGDAELTPPLMQGYSADGRLDDLRLPQPLPEGAGQAAQDLGRWGHLLHFSDCANDCDGTCRRAPQGFFQRKRPRRA